MNVNIRYLLLCVTIFGCSVSSEYDTQNAQQSRSVIDNIRAAYTGDNIERPQMDKPHLRTWQRHWYKWILPGLLFIGLNGLIVFIWAIFDYIFLIMGKYIPFMALLFPDHSVNAVNYVYFNNSLLSCIQNSTGYMVCQAVPYIISKN